MLELGWSGSIAPERTSRENAVGDKTVDEEKWRDTPPSFNCAYVRPRASPGNSYWPWATEECGEIARKEVSHHAK